METQLLLPALNAEELTKKAQEAAMKGALKSIEDYYTEWNSPYTKALKEYLGTQSIAGSFDLPDIIALINDSLSKEIDAIANEAVAKTFIPLIKNFLVRASKEMKFSDLLTKFVECMDAEDMEDCSVFVTEHERKWWLNVKISHTDKYRTKEYELTLHKDNDAEKRGENKYKLLSLPWESKHASQTMKLKLEDKVSLELPFTGAVLQDEFISAIARWVIAGTVITMDTDEFSEDMFPEKCHC